MRKGLFIVFEGIDGSGKSTQAKLLFEKLSSLNYSSKLTAEPTIRPIGQMIRKIFSKQLEMDNLVVAGLFVADRLDHLLAKEDGILDLLLHPFNVICDRYYLSSLAYQSVFCEMEWVIEANSKARSILKPDITFFLDLDPSISMERISQNRTEHEIYENLDNLKRVRQNYLKAIKLFEKEEKIITINANLNKSEISELIWNEIQTLISSKEVNP